MDLRTLLRGGVSGRDDPYINEKSPFAKYPLAPKGAPPPKKVPTPTPRPQNNGIKPLWKVPTPTARPDRPNPLQMAVDAAPYVPYPQTYAGQERGAGYGGGPQAAQDAAPYQPYPTIARDQGQFDTDRFGPQQPAPTLDKGPRLPQQQYPTIAEDQGMAPGLMELMLQMSRRQLG